MKQILETHESFDDLVDAIDCHIRAFYGESVPWTDKHLHFEMADGLPVTGWHLSFKNGKITVVISDEPLPPQSGLSETP